MTPPVHSLEIPDHFRRWLIEELRPLPWLFAIFAAFYAVELTTFQWSIDEALKVYRVGSELWVQQGRWTPYLLETFLLPQPVVPFLPHALFGLFVSVAYLVVLRTHQVQQLSGVHYALFPLFAAFPTWFFVLEFLHFTPAVGLGVLASAAAVAMFVDCLRGGRADVREQGVGRWLVRLAVAAAVGAVALGVYQSNLLLIVVLGGGVVLADALRSGPTLRRLAWRLFALALLVFAVVALYYCIWQIFLAALDIEPVYIGNYVRNQLFTDPLSVLYQTAREANRLYLGHPSVYGARSIGFGLVIAFGFAGIAVTPSLSGRLKIRVALLLLAIAILAMPFTLHLMSGGFMPYRSLVSLPATLWLFGFVGLTAGNRWIARATLVAVLLAACHALYVASLFQAGGALVKEHDRALAFALHDRIQAVHPGFSRSGQYKVECYGGIKFSTKYPQVQTSTRARSFFEWDGGNPKRIVAFMRLLGFDHVRLVTEKERAALIPVLEGMPIWPEPGCVRVVGDVTLVRLGEHPGRVHRKAGEAR